MMAQLTQEEFTNIIAPLVTRRLTREQLDQVIEACRRQRQSLTSVARYMFRTGDQVKWSGKYGEPCSGRVIKVMRKNADVTKDGDGRRWRVSLSLLEKA